MSMRRRFRKQKDDENSKPQNNVPSLMFEQMNIIDNKEPQALPIVSDNLSDLGKHEQEIILNDLATSRHKMEQENQQLQEDLEEAYYVIQTLEMKLRIAQEHPESSNKQTWWKNIFQRKRKNRTDHVDKLVNDTKMKRRRKDAFLNPLSSKVFASPNKTKKDLPREETPNFIYPDDL